MIKCINCSSIKVVLKLDDLDYIVINECFNCYKRIHLFIDDYFDNYKSCINLNENKNKDFNKQQNLCLKHSKKFTSFCFNCKINLCDECLLSHGGAIHYIQKINEIISKDDIEQNEKYKKSNICVKEVINQKLKSYTNKEKASDDFYYKLLNSLLRIIKLKELFLYLNINDKNINTYDLISLKNVLDKYNQKKIDLLINNIKSEIYKEKEKDINNYKNSIFFSINSIPNDKIINANYRQWINHVIQLRNGNIVTAHWEYLLVHRINAQSKKLESILKVNIHNGCVNHIYEYKKNKILVLDNKMKIIKLSPDNKNFNCLNILDYGRKIIPFVPPLYNGKNKFLLICTPNGIKVYSFTDDDNENIIDDKSSDVGENKNEIKFLGDFSTERDYSSIIQVNNKICGIFKIKNNFRNHFSCWEINHDFNKESKFDNNSFNLLGQVSNVFSGIGRYSISQLNDEYILVGTMKDNYHSSFPNEKSGISIISLDPVQIIQHIESDEITSILTLKNNIILTGGKNLENNSYNIRQWKFNEAGKELLYIGFKKMHTDFINTIGELKNGFFISCGRDGNIYIVYY